MGTFTTEQIRDAFMAKGPLPDLRFRTESGTYLGAARFANFLMCTALAGMDPNSQIDPKYFRIAGNVEGPGLDRDLTKVIVEDSYVTLYSEARRLELEMGSNRTVIFRGATISTPKRERPHMALVPENYAKRLRDLPYDTTSDPAVAASIIFGDYAHYLAKLDSHKKLVHTLKIR